MVLFSEVRGKFCPLIGCCECRLIRARASETVSQEAAAGVMVHCCGWQRGAFLPLCQRKRVTTDWIALRLCCCANTLIAGFIMMVIHPVSKRSDNHRRALVAALPATKRRPDVAFPPTTLSARMAQLERYLTIKHSKSEL